MKIEIRNVKYAAFASQETSCFSATIYADGVRAGDASNEGRGGATIINPRSLNDKIEVFAKTLPPTDISYMGLDNKTMPMSAELLVDDLLTGWLAARDLRKMMVKYVLFIRADKLLQYGPFKTPAGKDRVLSTRAWVAELNADCILNLLPFDKALVAYRKIT